MPPADAGGYTADMPARFPNLPAVVISNRSFPLPLVMGILNVTPDSFSDGGAVANPVDYALQMVADGADIVDIGGESTRPGAAAVAAEDEIARTVPVIRELTRRGCTVPISIDTSKPAVAAAALHAGASIVNDVTAGSDLGMFRLCAEHGCILILMHMRGTPRDMQSQTGYTDVVTEVRDYLQSRAQAAQAAGVARERIWIDPGFGFAKLPPHNCALVARLDEFSRLGYPVLIGASRKSTLGQITGRPVDDREPESLAAGLMAALNGASVLRVHSPGPMKRALQVAREMQGIE